MSVDPRPTLMEILSKILGGSPTVVRKTGLSEGSPGEYVEPNMVSKGDTLYLDPSNTAYPESFVAQHEMGHRLYAQNALPDRYRPSGNTDPAFQKIIADVKAKGWGHAARAPEDLAQAFGEAYEVAQNPLNAYNGPLAHRANTESLSAVYRWLMAQPAMAGKRTEPAIQRPDATRVIR